jgi:hypothetical protein
MSDLPDDLMMDVKMDASHDHHMNDPLGDLKMDESHANRRSGDRRNDLRLGVRDPDDHRRNETGDLTMDGNLSTRNCAPHDLKMDGKNLGVKSSGDLVFLSKNCGQRNRDHLRYGHLKLRYLGMSRNLGVMKMSHRGMNLDEKMNFRRVILKMGVHLMMGAKSVSYYRHDCLVVSLNNYLRTYLFLFSLVVARYLVVFCNALLVADVTYVTQV